MHSTLEVLRETERTLTYNSPPYQYSDWHSCTCGHIYMAAGEDVGHPAEPRPKTLYERVMLETAKALGWVPLEEEFDAEVAANYVSLMTSHYGGDRQAALLIVRRAIRQIEDAEEKARLKVIDQHNFELP